VLRPSHFSVKLSHDFSHNSYASLATFTAA
jgi:hypothetical protein